MNESYLRKLEAAVDLASRASTIDALREELTLLRSLDADPVIIAEVERILRRRILQEY